MANDAPTSAGPEKALIFIPDISGFTQFVSQTEISHSQHIIQELLNIILESNELGLEVSEVEGDAILFYKFGATPTSPALLAQVKRMFTAFHQHLKKYESHRICNCGACRTAHQLTIKFIAHYGDLAINKVQQFNKLFGKEVIVAHRLLKNDIDQHEYALFTDVLLEACPEWKDLQSGTWGVLQQSSQEYDSGKVSYGYVSLSGLHGEIPPLTPDDFKISGDVMRLLHSEGIIHAPIDLVFDVMSDLRFRNAWIPGLLPEFENVNTEIPQAGQTHKCLANGPVIASHDYSITPGLISFHETDVKKTQWMVYVLQRKDDHSTHLTTDMYVPHNVFKRLLFNLFMKKKLTAIFDQAWKNLAVYCEALVEKGERHTAGVLVTEPAGAKA